MTDNKMTEAQIESASEDTRAAEWRAKATRSDRLLVRMNHEIRSAANLILGLTDLMRESELSPSLRNNISVVRTSSEHMLNASAEIIDLARAELGCLQLSSTTFKLHDTLQQAMDLMSILASSKRVNLNLHLSRHLPIAVVGDPGRLSQILITLVRGSIERLEQGEVRVNVEHDPSYTKGVRIKFSVADNGRQLPLERVCRLFDGGLDDESPMGGVSELNLVLVKHLAKMMGGDLWIEVESKIGVVFHFSVDLQAPPMLELVKVHRRGVKTRTDQRPLKILIADDSADTLLLIRALLKGVPWGIETAENGRTALEMAVSRSYDLILMDLDMPEMNGYMATRQIRISECLREVPAVPIVALTAHNEGEAILKSIEAGCTAHVTKPIRKSALIETIQRYAVDRERPGPAGSQGWVSNF